MPRISPSFPPFLPASPRRGFLADLADLRGASGRRLACLHGASDGVRTELAAKVAMADVHVASANMQKAQTAPTVRALLLLQGGKAMSQQKDSPNSAEIVAQAKAGREGLELNFRFRLSIASVVVSLLVSAALKLLG